MSKLHLGRLILLFGQDPRLVETRGWVLEQAGYRLITILHLSDLDKVDPRQRIDMFLLCNSLASTVRRQALTLISSKWPKAKRLILASAGAAFEVDPAEAVFPAIEGPRKLVATIHNLMTDGAAPSL